MCSSGESRAPEVALAHRSAVPTSEASDACARTTPLDLTAFKTRRLIRLRQRAFKLDKVGGCVEVAGECGTWRPLILTYPQPKYINPYIGAKCRISQFTFVFNETFVFALINTLLIRHSHNNNLSACCISNIEITMCCISQFTLTFSEAFSCEFINKILMHHFQNNNSYCISSAELTKRTLSQSVKRSLSHLLSQ